MCFMGTHGVFHKKVKDKIQDKNLKTFDYSFSPDINNYTNRPHVQSPVIFSVAQHFWGKISWSSDNRPSEGFSTNDPCKAEIAKFYLKKRRNKTLHTAGHAINRETILCNFVIFVKSFNTVHFHKLCPFSVLNILVSA